MFNPKFASFRYIYAHFYAKHPLSFLFAPLCGNNVALPFPVSTTSRKKKKKTPPRTRPNYFPYLCKYLYNKTFQP